MVNHLCSSRCYGYWFILADDRPVMYCRYYAKCGRWNTAVADVIATIYRQYGRWNTTVADVMATKLCWQGWQMEYHCGRCLSHKFVDRYCVLVDAMPEVEGRMATL